MIRAKPASYLGSRVYFRLLQHHITNPKKKSVIQQKVLSRPWLITQHHPYMVEERLQQQEPTLPGGLPYTLGLCVGFTTSWHLTAR